VEAVLLNFHSIVAFMADGIVTGQYLGERPNVVKEGGDSKLGDWEYAPIEGGTFLHAGVYSMRKHEDGKPKTLTKTRGIDPKRVTEDEDAGELLTRMAVEKMSRPYDELSISQQGETVRCPYAIYLPMRDLVTIGQALSASERNRELWTRGFAGRWSPPVDSSFALLRIINLEKLGVKRQWIEGREDDWQTTRGTDGALRLANRVSSLVATIPTENPEPRGKLSAIYKPDWVDPDFGEDSEEAEEQEAINNGA